METDGGYVSELLAEKDSLDPSFVHCMGLLTKEINRMQGGGSPASASPIPQEDEKVNGTQINEGVEAVIQDPAVLPRPHILEHREHREPRPYRRAQPIEENKLYQPVKLSEKVFIPAKEHPKFNFVGKLLGPRGNTFKRLQNSTGTKMSILGKGSMRDKEKEDELKATGDAKYNHLGEELHVLIEVEAPPGQAHARLGIAIEEIKKYLIPETNDEIHQEQMREMAMINSFEEGVQPGQPGTQPPPPPQAPVGRGRGRARVAQVHSIQHAVQGRGVHITRNPVGLRRVPQGHQPISVAARSAAGLPSSPPISHPSQRAQAPPSAVDPYVETYDPAYGYEAAFPDTEEVSYYEYGRSVTPAELYETAYPAPARLPASMAASYKTTHLRPTKKLIREATYPY